MDSFFKFSSLHTLAHFSHYGLHALVANAKEKRHATVNAMTITLHIDNKTINAAEGTNLLEVCLDNGIYVPNLCYIRGMDHPPASCRLCFVDIESVDRPTPACMVRSSRDMVVHTDTPRVRQLQRTALQLLLSVHAVDCRNCPANRRCVLQDMAKFLKTALKSKHLDRFLKATGIDRSHPFLDYYPNRCVLCGRCVYVCRNQQKQTELTFARRGFATVIGHFDHPHSRPSSCDTCRACVAVCPVAALLPRA
jgi:bidirectional [NiFe] hydrogenase diaphorase subunit